MVYSPFSFKGGLWYISHRYHLFSWSDPHYGTVVALRGTHQPQTGERSPRKSPLQPDKTRGKSVRKRGHWGAQSKQRVGTSFTFFTCLPIHQVFYLFHRFQKRKSREQKLSLWRDLSPAPDMFQRAPKLSTDRKRWGGVCLLIFSIRHHSSTLHAGDLKCQRGIANSRKACHSCSIFIFVFLVFLVVCSCADILKEKQLPELEAQSCIKSL